MLILDLHWLEGGRILNAVSLVLAAAGIYFSFYFYMKSKREKLPVYWPNTYLLLKETVKQVDGLKITHNGRPIGSLSVTRVGFWNAGRDVIRRSDIATSNPITISPATPAEVLDAKLSYVHRAANLISIKTEADKVSIDFEYLGFEDGCIINIYHTKDAQFILAGSIIDTDSIYCVKPNPHLTRYSSNGSTISALLSLLISKRPKHPGESIKSMPKEYLDK